VPHWSGVPAPVRLETERLVIRRFEPEDAPIVKQTIDANLEHLRPFMIWAFDEPQPLEEKAKLLAAFRASFDAGDDFAYAVFDRSESELVGSTGLHPRVGPGGLEIGYWVRAERTRQGIATEVSGALTRVAIEVCGADRVEIRVDSANGPSHGIPRKLGFTAEATLRRRLPGPPGEPLRDAIVYSLFREELRGSPAAALEVAAFDASGSRVL
jgi:RimJ/RimL family protein N-acetyltransferase